MSWKGINNTGRTRFKKGYSPWNKGKPMSEGSKIKCSINRMGKCKGKDNNLWKGGKSFELYGTEFNNILKEKIRKKYQYRCQQCFRHQDELYSKKGIKYKLHIHHIDFDKKNNTESNLIPLCRPCHIQTQFNREQWIDYFKDKVI